MPSYTSPTGYSSSNEQLTSSVSHPVAIYNHPLSTITDYNGGAQPVYVGYSLPGTATTAAGWMIQYIQYDGNSNQVSNKWSPLYASFGDIWDNRASLNFS